MLWKLNNRPGWGRRRGHVKEKQLFCPDFHLHVKSLWRRAQKHKCFGKRMALLLTKTLEDIAKVEAQSLLRQNKYLIWCCLYLSHLKLGFFASFVPSSPHLAFDLHQKKPAQLPSSLPQQHPDEGLHSVLWPVTLCSSGQEGRPVCNRIFFCCSFILCCNFLAISALPFFVLSLSYFETGTGSGCAVHRNHAGYPPSSGEAFHQGQIIITVIFWKILPFLP